VIRINLRRAGIAAAGVTALSLSALVPSGHADYAPQPNA
jgi:hypothetical protein